MHVIDDDGRLGTDCLWGPENGLITYWISPDASILIKQTSDLVDIQLTSKAQSNAFTIGLTFISLYVHDIHWGHVAPKILESS